jgi:hypothetical protein
MRTRLQRFSAPVLALLLSAAVAGCGGSSGTELPAAATSPAGKQFIASADRICGQLNTRLLASAASSHSTTAQLARNAATHAELETSTIAQLNKLSAPAGLAGDWAQMLADRRDLAGQLVTIAHAWQLDDKQRVASLAKAKASLHVQIQLLAHKDGFTACSRVGVKA